MPIETVDSYKYLGIYLDKHLSYREHIDKIISKVNQRTKVLWKTYNYIDGGLAKYLYLTMIHPLYTYSDSIYDGCSVSNANCLQISQNAALRAVRKCPPYYPTRNVYSSLELDTLDVSRIRSTLKLVYRGVNHLGPPDLNEMFTLYKPTCSLRLENQMLLLPPKTSTVFATNDIAVRGCNY